MSRGLLTDSASRALNPSALSCRQFVCRLNVTMKPERPKRRLMTILCCVLLGVGILPRAAMSQDSTPHLRQQATASQLIVDGKPFLVLAGELGNSTSSSLEYMRPVWPKLVSLNLNTVLVPVYWELLEPVEGKFDFTLVDGLIQEARR